MKTPVTDIDAIMFPGESRRLLDAQIAYLNKVLAAIEKIPKTPLPAEPEAIEAALPEDCDLALPERQHYALSNGDTVTVDFYQISKHCWTAKDANHDGRTGVDNTRELALQDLLRMCEADLEDDCSDGRARVMTEPQRRDLEFRQKVARTEIQGDVL